MSRLTGYEMTLLAEAALLTGRKLKPSDLLEWSSSKERVQKNLRDGEVMVECPSGIWVALVAEKKKEHKP